MKEIRDTLEIGGGLGLLVAYPLILAGLLWGGLQSVGRGYFSRGANARKLKRARETLELPDTPENYWARSLAADAIRYSQL